VNNSDPHTGLKLNRLTTYTKTAGPGILFASTAIGVSHLVQSTRAGAEFGLMIMGFVILANVLKYPFFEYGSRYAVATQTSIIDGYLRLGRPALWMYFIITICSMFFVTGAVGFVTAGFFENLFGLDSTGGWTLVALFAICVGILAVGRYSALDGIIKIVAIVMLVSTVAAFAFALHGGPTHTSETFEPRELWDDRGIFFLLALMGWMPTAIDLSSWNSLWTLARIKQSKYRPTLKETLFEFRLAYVITAVLAVMFVTLGAFMFYGTGTELPNNNAKFAHSVITLYSKTIGEWSYILISTCAFSVMFGTIIAAFDGYSRSIHRTTQLLFTRKDTPDTHYNHTYFSILVVLALGSLIVILAFGNNLKSLVDFATVLSFVIAPVIAIFNFKLVRGRFLEKQHRPSIFLKMLSYAGLVFLVGFAGVFVVTKFF